MYEGFRNSITELEITYFSFQSPNAVFGSEVNKRENLWKIQATHLSAYCFQGEIQMIQGFIIWILSIASFTVAQTAEP